LENPPHLGVLAGVRSEADALIRYLPPDFNVSVYVSGAHTGRARLFAERLVNAGATHLLSFGYAGGLDPAYPPGTLILPRSVTTADGAIHHADGDWLERALELLRPLNPVCGDHYGVETTISEVEHKSTLFLRTRGAIAIDMESHVLAEAATRHELPFLAVRVILDSANHRLPPAAIVSIRSTGAVSRVRLLRSVLAKPSQIGALNRLARAHQFAEKTLLGSSSRGAPTGFGVR
jgi:nucleoside phosphorylase